MYDIMFASADDDGGSASQSAKVLITGNADRGRSSGYWAHQYRQRGKIDFDGVTLECYLQIASFVSNVFNEARDASTFAKAQQVLFAQDKPVTKRDERDRDLLTAWLNFANGAVEWGEPVDTDGDGTADVTFSAAMTTAESVRLDPTSSPAQIDAQRAIIQRINDTI